MNRKKIDNRIAIKIAIHNKLIISQSILHAS